MVFIDCLASGFSQEQQMKSCSFDFFVSDAMNSMNLVILISPLTSYFFLWFSGISFSPGTG